MKNAILIIAISLFGFTMIAQDKTKKTNFQFSKSMVGEVEDLTAKDIKKYKAKDFEDDIRTITIHPENQTVVFDLGFVEKTIAITDEAFSLIDKQWNIRLGDANFAFLTIGENYAIISLEEDKRSLIMITENFTFK